MKKSELIKLLNDIPEDFEVIIDVGRYSGTNWKFADNINLEEICPNTDRSIKVISIN